MTTDKCHIVPFWLELTDHWLVMFSPSDVLITRVLLTLDWTAVDLVMSLFDKYPGSSELITVQTAGTLSLEH